MSRRDQYNVICDRTGFKAKRSDCKKQWDGLLVLKRVWERRQPQDNLPSTSERLSVPDPRPETQDIFVDSVSSNDL